MKTITRNISLSEDLDHFAQHEAEAGAYGSLSEYFRELVRQRRQAQIDRDVAFLERASAGAPENESEAIPDILAAQKRARKRMKARKGQ